MKVLKAMTLVLTAGLLMGNQKCQEEQVVDQVPARELKKIVEVGLITSRPIEIPGGGNFDFQYVLNQQIYPVLQKSEKFWFRYEPVFKDNLLPNNSNSVQLANMNLTKMDYNYLQTTLATRPTEPVISDDVSCFVNHPQLSISGAVNSFEMVNKIGLNIGFTSLGSSTSGGIPHLGFDTETFQLDMILRATPPLTQTSLASVNITSKQTKTRVDFFIPFQSLLFEPSFFFQTPLAKVSYNALDTAVKAIHEQLKKEELKNESNKWHTRVLFDHEEAITILAGSNHNLKVGDTFDIYNEKAYWMSTNGEIAVPCESKLQGTIPGPVVATIQIDYVGEDLSRGKVIYETGVPRKMGALVKINKLVQPVAAPSATQVASASKSK